MTEAGLEQRLRRLLALEVVRIVEDLLSRREVLLTVWSRHRARQPFLDAMFSRWRTVEVRHLLWLTEAEIVAVEDFHRELDQLRTYAAYTEDMPMTVAERFDAALPRLAALGDRAVDALGGAPERPVAPDVPDVPDRTSLVDAEDASPAGQASEAASDDDAAQADDADHSAAAAADASSTQAP